MISVITPVYNGYRFMEYCLKNVIGQACSDMEHIVVDGGSTDGTIDIVRTYAERYGHIRWISEKDRGQSEAMNKGLSLARGQIVGFLNSDDFYEPQVLNRVSKLFNGISEPALLVGMCNVWDDNGVITEVNKPEKLAILDLLVGWSVNPFPINASQYFYHKSLHEKIGPYNVNEHFALDIDFLARAVQSANTRYMKEVWGNYRMISGTKTVTDINNGLCHARFLNVLNKYKEQLPVWQQWLISARRLIQM